MSEEGGKGRRRMDLPKRREDLERISEEVEAREHSEMEEEHHHHHHEEEVEDVVSVLELLVDSLNANYKSLESTVNIHSDEIIRIYKILAKIVEACGEADPSAREKSLKEAVELLRPPVKA
ncbi:hypothetical protein [Acidilobus sp.]|jgi:G3E family GTPase|uniref:hypothetical protein n=1 Tax=Acidilobus sp. TaxID=1872109 RepID=UPI003D0475AD